MYVCICMHVCMFAAKTHSCMFHRNSTAGVQGGFRSPLMYICTYVCARVILITPPDTDQCFSTKKVQG